MNTTNLIANTKLNLWMPALHRKKRKGLYVGVWYVAEAIKQRHLQLSVPNKSSSIGPDTKLHMCNMGGAWGLRNDVLMEFWKQRYLLQWPLHIVHGNRELYPSHHLAGHAILHTLQNPLSFVVKWIWYGEQSTLSWTVAIPTFWSKWMEKQ